MDIKMKEIEKPVFRQIEIVLGQTLNFMTRPIYLLGFTFSNESYSLNEKGEWIKYKDGDSSIPCCLRLAGEQLKDLARQIEDSGFTPDRTAKNEGELIATKNHLSDLRKIVSKKLEVNLDE